MRNKTYDDLTVAVLKAEYIVKKRSCGEIAIEYNTYPKKVLRLLKKLGFQTRSREESQRLSAETNHPTRGKKRTDEEKLKISNSRAAKWDDAARKTASEKTKESWKHRSKDKDKTLSSANEGLRESAKNGSKLEVLVWEVLDELGYKYMTNESILVDNKKMRVDIYVAALSLIIEVDGPFHFLPIYGEEKLNRTRKADSEKNALVLKDGINILRIGIVKKNVSKFDNRKIQELAKEHIMLFKSGKAKGLVKVEYEGK